jgi:thymidylate synthase
MNMSSVYISMLHAVTDSSRTRKSADPMSPCQQEVHEASPGQTFHAIAPLINVVDTRSFDLRWAVANVLHFFAETEEANVLSKYNANASKFLDASGRFLDGAYGPIALSQLRKCVERLKACASSRRAIVYMDTDTPENVNVPSCWSFFQFLVQGSILHMCFTQRSLSLAVMPYDAILLTNILHWVGSQLELPLYAMHWNVGSLHGDAGKQAARASVPLQLLLPSALLSNPRQCLDELHDPGCTNKLPMLYSHWLRSTEEVRT